MPKTMPMKGLLTYCMLGVLLLTSASSLAERPLMVQVPQLTLDTALHIAENALLSCRHKGFSVAVTLLDRGGHAQVVLRDTFTPDLALAISRDKAYTALSFDLPTSSLGQRAYSPLGHMPHMAMFPGGLPIHAGGTLVGAIGVSGAPSGIIDASCAEIGIDSLQTDLDMSGG